MEHLRYLESQFLNENLADIDFIIETDVGTVKIPSHKVILSSGSWQFSKRFTDCVDLKKIEIFNSTKSSFEEFLFTFYSSSPEKNFTIENAAKVLTLAKTFEVGHCIKASERFLIKNLPLNQICFGYCLAIEFGLADLKIHCFKQINEKKHEVFKTQSFFACDQDALNDILENVTIKNDDEITMVWNACMNWAEKQCIMRSIDASDMGQRRELLGKCFNRMQLLAAKNDEFLKSTMENSKELFDDDTKQVELSSPLVTSQHLDNSLDCCNSMFYTCVKEDVNQIESDELIFDRFRETILSPQACYADVPISIEFQSTKEVALIGMAFSTVTGAPKGKITILQTDAGRMIAEQQIQYSNVFRHEPKNFISIENVILEPETSYTIKIEFAKDIIYRSSRRISNQYHTDDFTVSIKAARRDIFSHFVFSECF
ncbi:BTB/POZ domain-containing protein 3-like [Contarinia nasturtii]|uniref:BTB/POZ domain-containing protein 3-like n=1 Tax=Contarinia nasturtii TaxID=265458 RepID=UPI0012D4BCE1|nr:BTB/POZ domain-containing protein 3-like [Contarinia nasturtii]